MLVDRIIGAFTFRKGIYAEVEADKSFTSTAWILVAVIAFLNQLGSWADKDVGDWFFGTIGGTVFAVIGFAVAALIVNFAGRTIYKADVTFNELVRTLGLAYVWQLVGVLGVITAFSSALSCILAPVMIAAAILLVVAWFIAAKEALDLDWLQTIITVVLGWIAFVVIMLIAGAVLGLLGLGAAALGSAFGL